MSSLLTIGFLIGIRHALEADHIATVASLAATQPSRRHIIRQGVAWGFGHSLMLLAVGLIVLQMDVLIPEQVASNLELIVGATMLLLGIDVIRRAIKLRVHAHPHQHQDGSQHLHFHAHSEKQLADHNSPEAHKHLHTESFPLKALMIGLVHGLAGSAALILLFVHKIDSFVEGLGYLLTFGIGSIAGMLIFSIVISVPLGLTAKKLARFYPRLQFGVGLLTSGIGLMILMEGIAV